MDKIGKGTDKSKVIHLKTLSKVKAAEKLREISKYSHRVFFTDHARERMIEREITKRDIFRVLESGQIIEEPFWVDSYSSWEMTVEGASSGHYIKVAVALSSDKKGDKSIIITAYDPTK